MKNFNLIVLGVVILVLFSGCTSTTSNQENTISGKVIFYDNSIPTANADIYVYANEKDFCTSEYIYSHKIETNSEGEYTFMYSTENRYKLYSELKSGLITTHYSQYVYVDTSEELIPLIAEDIALHERSENSNINLIFESNIAGVDTDSIKVFISKIEGINLAIIDSFVTTDEVSYLIENVATGYYYVNIEKTTFVPEENAIVILNNTYGIPFIDGINAIETTVYLDYAMNEKPAIYIYPEKAEVFQVSLLFKEGVNLVKSIPNYGDSWEIFIDVNGKIENKYDYLFYECIQPINFKFQNGYCFSSVSIDDELKQLLREIGLNKTEIEDFIDYWSGRFNNYDYYKIYPIFNNEIDNYVELDIDPKPDSILRVWLYFEGCNNYEELSKPTFNQFKRNKITAVEWGGVMIN